LSVPIHLSVNFICQALRGEPSPWTDPDPDIGSEEFLQLCRYHGVQALVYQCMRERDEWRDWPQKVRLTLESSNKAGVAAELLRAHYLAGLLKHFEHLGIRSVLIKGEALAVTHYAVPGTRVRCDSDIFIPIHDIGLVKKAVRDAGLWIVSPVYKSHQFTVVRQGTDPRQFALDIHWRILNDPRFARTLSFDDVYECSTKVPGFQDARALNAVDALLLACMHRFGNKSHDRDRLIWIYDIHLLVSGMTQQQKIEFAEKSVELTVQMPCFDGLSKSREFFGTDVPDGIMELLATDGKPATLARRVALSNLGLLVDDWKTLGNYKARLDLMRELFLPSAGSLMSKYGKDDPRWLPLLWLRQVFGGLTKRLLLK